MISITEAALAGFGCPACTSDEKACGKTGSPFVIAWAARDGCLILIAASGYGKISGSPIQQNTISLRRHCHAFCASSGPIPDGSPQVISTGLRVIFQKSARPDVDFQDSPLHSQPNVYCAGQTEFSQDLWQGLVQACCGRRPSP